MKMDKLVQQALNEIDRSCDVQCAQVACVVLNNNVPIFATANRRGTGKCSTHTNHAEELAIRRLMRKKWYSTDLFTLIVIRTLKNGKLAMAKPCIRCQQLIKMCQKRINLSGVIYTNEAGKFDIYLKQQ